MESDSQLHTAKLLVMLAPMPEADIARAIAFFEACDDLPLLLEQLRRIRPRAAAEVGRLERMRRRVPPPADVLSASSRASQEEAVRTVSDTRDFAWMQALARARSEE